MARTKTQMAHARMAKISAELLALSRERADLLQRILALRHEQSELSRQLRGEETPS
jgi:hypothetical protein